MCSRKQQNVSTLTRMNEYRAHLQNGLLQTCIPQWGIYSSQSVSSPLRHFRSASFGLAASLNRFIGAPGTVTLTHLESGGKWRDTAVMVGGDLTFATPVTQN